MFNRYLKVPGSLAFLIFAVFAASISAQTSNDQKLSYLLLSGSYGVSNGYAPNGVHAGVDFNGTGTGVTSVYAPISGTVVANTSTCGKFAIFDGTNTVIMAHMTALSAAAVNSTIKRGDYVGKAAQVIGGGCSASGPHLHIEIRTGNNSSMAIPTNNNTSTTINPLTYFSYNEWEFNANNNLQEWDIFNFSAYSVNGGTLFIDPWGSPNDPYVVSPYVSLETATYPYINTRFASNGLDGNAAIYFKTSSENYFSEDKKVTFTAFNCSLCGNAQFYAYSVYMAGNSKWTGRITGIRMDPAQQGQGGTNQDSIGIDYVRISTTP